MKPASTGRDKTFTSPVPRALHRHTQSDYALHLAFIVFTFSIALSRVTSLLNISFHPYPDTSLLALALPGASRFTSPLHPPRSLQKFSLHFSLHNFFTSLFCSSLSFTSIEILPFKLRASPPPAGIFHFFTFSLFHFSLFTSLHPHPGALHFLRNDFQCHSGASLRECLLHPTPRHFTFWRRCEKCFTLTPWASLSKAMLQQHITPHPGASPRLFLRNSTRV